MGFFKKLIKGAGGIVSAPGKIGGSIAEAVGLPKEIGQIAPYAAGAWYGAPLLNNYLNPATLSGVEGAGWTAAEAGLETGVDALAAAGEAGAGFGSAGAAASSGLGKWLVPSIVGGQLASAGIGYSAARQMADAQIEAAKKAGDVQMEQYWQNRKDMLPYIESGGKAIGDLEQRVMAGPGEFNPETEPGYQFGYKEFVEKPLLQRASATGKLRSGNTLRELSDRAQDYASMKYDSWLNRWLTRLNPLQSLAGVGQTSASTTAGLGANMAQGIAQTNLAAGNALAGQYGNQANALTGGMRGAGQTLMDAAIWNQMSGGKLFA